MNLLETDNKDLESAYKSKHFTFDDNSINNPIADDLKEWKRKAIQLKNSDITFNEYMEWKLRSRRNTRGTQKAS
ncbi:MAG: hypothetical protein K6C14_02705 [Eubacterium sp.]|nr:hypothetical protein [Eubacterium sp.]